ncbi:MAG: type II toxin-antitoxin system RelE/ParE family toxin [Nanoarchaeota archaeon]|nr:type II toxin-antitoxin system RelE/ParE family toxin [Nanoarchaeota archaeon]MBU1501334.1 type II toxin-antitoxin system RelE/ParE family toxin [Nanoarchaeota archaeon]
MVRVIYDEIFKRAVSKTKDSSVQKNIKNKISKIIDNPEVGKPMGYGRKGTREVYVDSFRLSYRYTREKNLVEFLDFYHKDRQ